MREYGLIGFPLSHSFSQKYFTEKFLRDDIADAAFLNFSIPQIQDVENIFTNHPQLKGLAVTIPYKKSIIKYIDEIDDTAKQIAACNCIKIHQQKKMGFNTDVVGFEKSFIKNLQPHHTKALVLGTGGASYAVQFVLKKLGIDFLIVSRQASTNTIFYPDVTSDILHEYNIIINCTPLGTYPNSAEAPQLPYQFLNASNYLFDLIYNPPLTKFLEYGSVAGSIIKNGYEMLILQAEENWNIWNS